MIITLCAVAIAAVTVARQLRDRPSESAVRRPHLVQDWERILDYGTQIGDPDSEVQLVEFIDYECPFCRSFHRATLRPILEHPAKPLGVVLVNFPLFFHDLALPLAQGAECASAQGALSGYADAVFSLSPESLETDEWMSIGSHAAVADVETFATCAMEDNREFEAWVSEGVALAQEMGVIGTPTIFIDGWNLVSPPDEREIWRVVDALLAGEDPF